MPLSPFYGNVDVTGAYDKARTLNQQLDLQKVQEAGALQKLLEGQRAIQEQQQLQSVVAQAGGDVEKAIQSALRAGNIAAAAKLAPLRKQTDLVPVGPRGLYDRNSGTVIQGTQETKEFAPPEIEVLTKRLEDPTLQPPTRRYLEARIKYLTERANADNPAPVTPATIADPANPNETLVVDARTQKVIGKGPKLTQVGGQERQLELDLPKARERVDIMTQNLDKMEQAITDLEAMPGLNRITGTVMGRTPNISNAATTAQAKLDSLKSQVFVSALQSMREASKTGGAVGNVSDREGDKMERTIAALDQAQGTASFRAELKRAKEQLRTSKAIIRRAFEDQFRGVQARQAPAGENDPLGLRK